MCPIETHQRTRFQQSDDRQESLCRIAFRNLLDLAHVPVDVVTKLAFSIQEADDLFAFLEALRLSNNLGPLQHLLQLGLTHDHSDLWPSLRLSSSTLDGASISPYEAIIKYYSSVIVEDDCHDVEWLKTHLNPEAAIEWRVNRFLDKIDHLNAWTDLRITSLRLQINDYFDLGWKVVLPRLHQLTTLHVDATQGDLGDLYEIVAKSPRITEFKAFTNGLYQVDEKDVVNLIKWFRRQPVRVFEAQVAERGNLIVDLRQTMYEVMFNCPTLDRLRNVEDSSYDGIDFTKFTFPLQSLRLQSSHLTSDIVRSFSCQLENSRLNFLELIDYKDQNVDGAECLLRVLPRTRIKHLDFSALEMSPTNWCRLAPSFEVCGLESLLLGAEAFSSTFIESLATAIQKNHTISQLYLCTENIDPPTLEILIQSFSLPNRQLSAKRMIKLITYPSTRTNLSYMQNLKEFAALRECEFVQAELKPNSLATLNFRS